MTVEYLHDTREQAMLILFGDDLDEVSAAEMGKLPLGTHFHLVGEGLSIYELVGPAIATTLSKYGDTVETRTWRLIS